MKPPEELEAHAQASFIWQRWPQGEVLIVVDDVTDYKAVSSCLPLANPRFKVLITTRIDFGRSVRSLCLEELDNESALELLETLAGRNRIASQLEDAKTLCSWVGNLPLGLELLGRYLANDLDLSVEDLLQDLEAMRLDAEALLERENGMTAQLGIAAALELSWKNLQESEKELACVLGMFAIAPILWQQVESCLPETPTKALVRARNKGLLKRNLLKRIDKGTYQLHQIVQEFFRVKLHATSGNGQVLKEEFCKVMVAASQGIDNSPTLDVIEEMRVNIPHLEEVINVWADHIAEDDMTWPYIGICRFHEGQGNYGLALPWMTSCLKHVSNRKGEENLDIATITSWIALLYYNQGRYEAAEPLYQQALEMRQKLLGNEHPDVASSLNNLAGLYKNQGRYEVAEPLYQLALTILLQRLGENHPNTQTVLNNFLQFISAAHEAGQGDHLSDHPITQEMIRHLRSQA